MPGPIALTNTLCYVGAATSCYLLTEVARHLYIYLRPSSLPKYHAHGKDSWALVTGATDGIGLGFAQELCRRGFNVFLHGRNREKLLRVQEQLKAESPSRRTKIIVFDATGPTDHIDEIAREIGDAHLTVLVNNVGGQGGLISNVYKPLQDMTHHEVELTISLNARFMTHITRVLLPVLERNEPSLIINVSSVASNGFPWLSIYSAAKGYVDSFTKSLDAEITVDGKKIEVLGLRVANVNSSGNDAETGLFNPTGRTMASAALNRVGCGELIVWGYWWHRLQGLGFDWLPRRFMNRIVTNRLRILKSEDDKKGKQK